MRRRHTVKYIHEGRYVAAVDVELIHDETGWSPYLSIEDAFRLDDVRGALRRDVPRIRGPRIPVSTVVGMVADDLSTEQILEAYPDLENDDVIEALRYAAYIAAVQAPPPT